MAPSSWSLDGNPPEPPGRMKHHWWRFIEHHLPNLSLFMLVAALAAVVLYPYVVVTVESGQVGVLWKRFACGTVMEKDRLYEEGIHFILPWDVLFQYDLRLQTATETFNAISRDGVTVSAQINVRFMLDHDSIPYLHEAVGPSYLDRLVKPEVGSRTREVIANYSAEQVYSTSRQAVEDEIKAITQKKLGTTLDVPQPENVPEKTDVGPSKATDAAQNKPPCPPKDTRGKLLNALHVNDTLVLGIELPAAVVTAINRKAEQYYVAQEYIYRVERERRESERKQIEAVGIRDFQQTVSQGISDSYLRWRGIEATLQLAQSSNTKIVIIGSGKDGLPIILGNVDAPSTPPSARPETDASAAKPTAASPAKPAEKTPTSNLSTPSEKTPSSSSAEKTPASSEADKPKPVFPLSFSDLKSLLERATSSTEPTSESAAKPAETKPAESKPAESKPAETKPAESKSSDSKSAEKPK
jgi:regulator of protease activity HflC (stomatin/prohibitin superfamily)